MRLYDQVGRDDVMMMVLIILMLRCPHHELLLAPVFCPAVSISGADDPSVSHSVTTAITFKTLCYAKRALTPR